MSYEDRRRYWQRWTLTVSGRTKEAVKKAMDRVTAPAQGFRLLHRDDIFSVSSASTGIEDRKEGDKMQESEVARWRDEGEAREVGYEMGEEEVKDEMYLQVVDVILFNRKTKKIEYRENIVAHDVEGAYMLAAQAFGKYDPKIHVKYAHCMFSFVEDDKE